MKYTIENIQVENNFLFFWGHKALADGTITKSCFSQWWPSSFKNDGHIYPTAEHWMMGQKALLFEDKEIFEQILNTASPALAKKLGRQVKNFDDSIWIEHRYRIVKDGNLLKFSQNIELKEFLIQTNSKILVEASPLDRIWGIGMTGDKPSASIPAEWRGLNLLGFALMEVRDILSNYNKKEVL